MSKENTKPANDEAKASPHRRLVTILLLTTMGMFGVGFAMVPLYKLVCSVTGINSISQNSSRVLEKDLQLKEVDMTREIIVQFDVTLNEELPFEVSPKVKQLRVRPGEPVVTAYIAKNLSQRTIVSQAVPGVTPWQATEFFHKIECFCFSQQTLVGGEEKEMGLRFIVDPDLPKDITVLTLSYTFMDTAQEAGDHLHEHPRPQDGQAGGNKLGIVEKMQHKHMPPDVKSEHNFKLI